MPLEMLPLQPFKHHPTQQFGHVANYLISSLALMSLLPQCNLPRGGNKCTQRRTVCARRNDDSSIHALCHYIHCIPTARILAREDYLDFFCTVNETGLLFGRKVRRFLGFYTALAIAEAER
jgi:hypothetical protein